MNNIFMKGLAVLFIQFLFINGAYSASCKGRHANDPGCITPSATTSPVVINSVSIDWLNETIIIYGANFSGSTTVNIAGAPATISNQTSTQLDIAFPSLPKGNHNLVVTDSSGTDSISFFAKGAMVDPTLIGCPCEPTSGTGWSSTLSPLGLWNKGTTTNNTTGTVCYEVVSGGSGTPADIAATILSNPDDPTAYPVYPIGAAFTEDPNESVCQLTKVDDAGAVNLLQERINRQQQTACRDILAANICNSITDVSSIPSF